MKETVLSCDIKDHKHTGEVRTFELEVIFDHDQEDGKSKTAPYLDTVKVEMCEGCRKYMFENRAYIYAYGAMGYNTYTL